MSAARVLSLQVTPENLDAVIDTYRNTLIPELEKQVVGFSSLLLLVDPDTGSAFDITLFDSEENRVDSEKEGGMLEHKMETLASILDRWPTTQNYKLKLIS